MNPKDIPPGFSGVHYAMVLGNVPQYCVSHSVNGKKIQVIQDESGVLLMTDECQFKAIVEFHSPKHSNVGIHDPKRWWVGFVQNLTAGHIVYQYRNRSNLVVNAAISPETVPCRDSGSPEKQCTFFFEPGLSLKQFGVKDEGFLPRGLGPRHPLACDSNIRYIEMGDGPGTGKNRRDLDLPCKEAGDRRAVVNKVYTIGWTDPLDPKRGDQDIATLRKIEGRLIFKTWVGMTFGPATIADAWKMDVLFYLHSFEWEVNFNATVNGRVVTPGAGAGARLIREGACHSNTEAIVTGPDANDSACVKFLRRDL